jgi:uncharacterized repeat protein (TIGR01451 family)
MSRIDLVMLLFTQCVRLALVALFGLCAQASWAQVCAAPGKDAPGTVSGVINTYYAGNGNLATSATTLTLGAASGATGNTVSTGDLLLIIGMQGATYDASDDERYGDGTGTAAAQPLTSLSQANGYLDANQAGLFEYVRVTAAAGNNITFAPALTNAYAQDTASTSQARRTYQVIRVPQLPSATINAASQVIPLDWNGAVGGLVALDVTGILTFTGAGNHIEASNRGFRGGGNYTNSGSNYGIYNMRENNASSDGGIKGEGISGTPRYVQTSVQGTFNDGTQSKPGAYQGPSVVTDYSAAHIGYLDGAGGFAADGARGAPGNAGGGGNSHNAAGGGGGNGGAGGSGGQTYNGDGFADRGGYGGAAFPQTGSPSPTRLVMGGGGGAGSVNNASNVYATGGRGGAIVMLRAGILSGSGRIASNGQRGFDPNASNDPAGGGGAGGSVMVLASSGHGNITVEARGGNGGDSNYNDGPAPYMGNGSNCCGGEREGPGGGGGGGVVMSNASLGSTILNGGSNGLSDEDLDMGFSGNLLAFPGSTGVVTSIVSSAVVGVRPGFECEPVLTVSKFTTTPSRSVPTDTVGNYEILVSNASTAGAAFGVAIQDILPSPFTLNGATAAITYGAGASGPTSPMVIGGTSTVVIGTAGHPTNAFTLAPGASLTASFAINLNSATAGTYQNPAVVQFTDPTRSTGGGATSTLNPAVSPGGTDAAGQSVGGSNYNSASSTQEDIVITGLAGTNADLQLTKSGSSVAEIGQAVNYTLLVSSSGPANITGSITVSDTVPAAIGTVTWSCTLLSGLGDCDTAAGGTGAAGSGNVISLPRVALNSGAQIQIAIQGTALNVGTITNTATVSLPPGYTDPTPDNNTGTATTVISTPTADLSITKSNGVNTVTSGGVTAYTIAVGNAGPSAAHGATVSDSLSAGLSALSISCSAAGGASCPGSLTTSTFASGVAIPNFPAGSTVTFTLNALITAASGSVTNTAAVSAPAGVSETNTTNNTASDSDAVTTTVAVVSSAATMCPVGTSEQLVNVISNGDIANTAVSLGSNVTQYPVNIAAIDTSIAPQSGLRSYSGGLVRQNPFPGDVARSIPSANNWVYVNGNNTAGTAPYRIWSQALTGLVQGRTYQFSYYGSSARDYAQTQTTTISPEISLRVTSGTQTFILSTSTYANEYASGAGTDTWTLHQSIFNATSTAVTLALWDGATGNNGDDFAFTQLQLRECRPNADPFVTKSNGVSQLTALTTTQYVITVGNNGPGPADSVLVADPVATGLVKSSVVCAATGAGAACPPSMSVSGLESPGLTIPNLPAGTTVVFTVTASVTALNGTVTNTVNLTLPSGLTDNNTGNNSANDVDSILGQAYISISKTNGTNTLVAGSTMSYTITVANGGPSDASGSVLRDPVATGLSCTTAAICSASGGASCISPIPMATLQNGYTIPSFPSGGQLVVTLVCGILATGQ